jgi:hypothetical protein
MVKTVCALNKIKFDFRRSRMKRLSMIVIVGLLLVGLLTACGGGDSEPAASSGGSVAAAPESAPNTLTAVKVDATSLDMNAAYWADAPVLSVDTQAAVDGNPDGPIVKMQAVYDGQYLVIRSEWADETESVMKSAWTWDGTAFTKANNEDRIMMTWPIGNNAEFASKGCAAACHNSSENQDKWWMGSDDAAVRYDAWQWKAARTNPVGYTDDKWWGMLEDAAVVDSSRHGDAKDSGGETSNVNDDKSGPAYMNGGDLSASFILQGEEVAIDTAALSAGDVVPGYLLAKAVGSRGDVEATGVWSDGVWVVVQRRLLNTGHDDDIVFTPPKPAPFGMSVVDNGGGLPHTVAPEVLTLEWD